MPRVCEICGKKPQMGSTVTHAHNVNKRLFKPNLRVVKSVESGTPKKVKMCMKCLKAKSKI